MFICKQSLFFKVGYIKLDMVAMENECLIAEISDNLP